MKRLILCFSFALAFSIQVQAQGTHVVLGGSSYLSGVTPQVSETFSTLNNVYGCWIDARVTSLRLNHTSDQVLWDLDGFGILMVKAGVDNITKLEFTPSRAGGGIVKLDITGRTSLMVRVAFDFYHSRYFMQVWDRRGQNTLIDSAATSDASQLPLAYKSYTIGAKRDGALPVQADIDFFRLIAPKGIGHSPTSNAPFPDFLGGFDNNPKLLRYEFESNLTNQGEGSSTLTASGNITYATNANTPPMAQGEDRAGQSKGTFLLNGTDSYDFEHGLSNTATWTCLSVPAEHQGCSTLTIRSGGKLASFVDGANVPGTYTFSLQVSDGEFTSTDSSVTIGVSNVSASAINSTCYVGENCVIDASASTGYETIDVALGDGFSQRIARSVHTYYAAGSYPITVTAQAADNTTSTATATATVTNRPLASGANTIDMTSSGNSTYFVSLANCIGDPTGNMAKLQLALDAASAVNTAPQKIIVRANDGSGNRCVYQGSLITREPAGMAQILIQSSAVANLPALHQRINPATHEQFMPKLLTTTANNPVLQPEFGKTPAYYKFEGIDFQSSSQQDTGIVTVGDPEQINAEAKMPHNFVFWHCAIRPTSESSVNIKNAMTVNGHSVTVLDSYIGPNSYAGNESHGFGITYGTKLSFINNFNGGASIPILVGGSTSAIEGATSADLEYRQNYNFRDPAWRTDESRARGIKNLFELKNAIRVVVEGNRLENNWLDGQRGHAILFQCVYDSGDWCKIEDVDFRNNFILNSTSIGTINGREYNQATNIRRITFRNNLWQNINPPAYGSPLNPTPHLEINNGPLDIRLEHNTFRQPNGTKTVSLLGDAGSGHTGEARTAGFVWRDNIADGWGCGFFGNDIGCGPSAINHYLHGYVISHSIAVGDNNLLYPSATPENMMFPATESAVGFTNAEANVWSLATGTSFKGKASDLTDPGVNWSILQSAVAHTTGGNWPQTTLPSPWQTQDIGSVGVAGSANYSNGTFTVNGSGADIAGNNDSFRYVYRKLVGDGQIVARITGVQNTHSMAKVGVMIRQTLSHNSANATLHLNPTNGGAKTEFMTRASADGANETLVAGGSAVSLPQWLKLVRRGNTFTASISSDGTTWTLVGSASVTMYSKAYIGLVVCSANNTVLNTSTFDNVSTTVLPSVSYRKSDVTKKGSWQGAYGAEGYALAGDGTSYPAYAQVSFTGHQMHTWAATTTDVRALQKSAQGSADRIAATWYSATGYTIDLNLTDGAEHQVALYVLDWDGNNNRVMRVEMLDAATNALLGSRDVTAFSGGQYMVWNLRGHVKLKVVYTGSAGYNAVVSGLFFDPVATADNMALGKTATQSSDSWGGFAALAVDGNTSGNWNDGSVTHTSTQSEAWWQVDLGSIQQLGDIKIWNRTDCCGSALTNFYVFVSDNPFTSPGLTATQGQAGVSGFHVAGTAGTPTTVMANRTGRYIRIQLVAYERLSLAEVEVFGTGLWETQDVGSVGIAGSASYTGDTFTINGSGADIWGSADSFRYVHQTLAGDGQIVARVTGVQNTSGSAKAGVMIRETLDDNSAHVVLNLNPTTGGASTEFMKRGSIGANEIFVAGGSAVSLPQWLKLVRSGNTFTASISSDGTTWTPLGSATVAMANSVYIGLVVCSANNSVVNTSTFDNVSKTP